MEALICLIISVILLTPTSLDFSWGSANSTIHHVPGVDMPSLRAKGVGGIGFLTSAAHSVSAESSAPMKHETAFGWTSGNNFKGRSYLFLVFESPAELCTLYSFALHVLPSSCLLYNFFALLSLSHLHTLLWPFSDISTTGRQMEARTTSSLGEQIWRKRGLSSMTT